MNEDDIRRALEQSTADVNPTRARLATAQKTAVRRRRRRDAATAVVVGGVCSFLGVLTFVNINDGSTGVPAPGNANINLAAEVEATAEVPVPQEQSASRPKFIIGAAASGRLVVIDSVTGKTTSVLAVFKDQTEKGLLPGYVSLTPDNKFVYFDVIGSSCDPDIMRVPVAGGDVEKITSGTAPAVSPDGASLVFVRHRDCFRTEVIRRDINSGVEDVIGTTTAPKVGMVSWSADGRTVAVDLRYDDASRNKIVIVPSNAKSNLDDTAALAVASDKGGTVYEWPSYLPNGSLFVSERCCATATGVQQQSSRLLTIDPTNNKVNVVAIGVANKDHSSTAVDTSGKHLLYLSGTNLMISDDGARPSPIAFGLVGATWH